MRGQQYCKQQVGGGAPHAGGSIAMNLVRAVAGGPRDDPCMGVAAQPLHWGGIAAGHGAILVQGFILDQISLHNGILHVVEFCIKLINDIRENVIIHCKGNHI